jgi:Arc/MetJ-type ribon-helix-helix transcriptional regulator
MTIHLPKDLELFVHDAVRTGRYAREDDVIRDALTRLRQLMAVAAEPHQRTKRAKITKQKKPLTPAEFDRHLMEIGLMSQLADTAADFDDPADEPISIKGEPLSKTVIRERR